MNNIQNFAQADLVITISRFNEIHVIKNRNGKPGPLDFSGLLALILPYQEKYLHTLILSWIDKLKIYSTFS